MVKRTDFTFLSRDAKTYIHAVKWEPEKLQAKAFLQLVHGMTEHIDRYDDFARFVAEKGFIVVGHDHLGHGTSVQTKADWGYFAPENPDKILIQDIQGLKLLVTEERSMAAVEDITKEASKELPYFILGHSMGSYLLREYLGIYDDRLSGAIIMGTGYESDKDTSRGLKLISLLSKLKGERHRSKLVKKMTMGKAYDKFDLKGNDLTRSWLTRNPKVVDEYIKDPRCTFLFTLNGYRGLISAVRFSCDEENVQKIQKDIPLLLISGEDDPVGNLGEGVKRVFEVMKNVGIKDVSMNLYPGCRHEILNEINNEKIYEDILNWMLYRIKSE